MGSPDDPTAQVEEALAEAAFRDAVEDVRDEFHGLLDEEAAAMVALARRGRLETGDEETLWPGREVTVDGVVHSVHDLRTFQRADGEGQVLNVDLSTDDGRVRLVLWDDDARRYERLQPGETLRIEQGYVKEGRYGPEVHLGRNGELTRTGSRPMPDDVERGRTRPPHDRPTRELSGVLEDRDPTRTFSRDDGRTGFVAGVVVRDDSGEREVTLWDEAVRQVQRVPVGERVVLRGLVERDGELHSTSRTEVECPNPDASVSLDAFGT